MSCVIGVGTVRPDGYVVRSIGGRLYRAHRLAWEDHYGWPPPIGYHIHHTCHNRACVNIEHLEVMSKADHGRAHALTTCRNGHERNEQNTYINPRGYPYCRVCRNERERGYRASR